MNPGTPHGQEERASASGLFRAIALYIEARVRLLHIEGQEAGLRITGLSGLFMMSLAAFIIGWMLAAPALVWLVADTNGWHWTRVALAGAGAHIVLGLLLLAGLKSRMRSLRLFEETFQQFRKDREWLVSNKNN